MAANSTGLKSLPVKVTDEQIKENRKIIEVHRNLVYTIGKTVYPEYDFASHDLSKFSEEELVPYTIKFILKLPDDQNPGWQSALQHHYDHNSHHPQYWKGKPMSEEELKESIVDMAAAKYQYRENQRETLGDHLTPDMFDFQECFLQRYLDSDREKVKAEIARLKSVDWSKIPVVGN